MRDAVAIPMQSSPMRIITKHWQWISSALMLAMAIGVAKGKYFGVESRVEAIEQTHPEATAGQTQRNTEEIAAMRGQVERIAKDTADTRVDVARLCAVFGLQPTGAIDQTYGPTIGKR